MIEYIHAFVKIFAEGNSNAKTYLFIAWLVVSLLILYLAKKGVFDYFKKLLARIGERKLFFIYFFISLLLWIFGAAFTIYCLNYFGAPLSGDVSTLVTSPVSEWEKSMLVHTHFIKSFLYATFHLSGKFDFGRPFFYLLSQHSLLTFHGISLPYTFLLIFSIFGVLYFALLILKKINLEAIAFIFLSFCAFVSFFDGGWFSIVGVLSFSYFTAKLFERQLKPFGAFSALLVFSIFSVLVTAFLGVWVTYAASAVTLFFFSTFELFDVKKISSILLFLVALSGMFFMWNENLEGTYAKQFFVYGLPENYSNSQLVGFLNTHNFSVVSSEKSGWAAFLIFNTSYSSSYLTAQLRKLPHKGYLYADAADTLTLVKIKNANLNFTEFLGMKKLYCSGGFCLISGYGRNNILNGVLTYLTYEQHKKQAFVISEW